MTASPNSIAPHKLVRHRAQDGVERREVPHRRNVLRRVAVSVRRLEVRMLEEVAAHFRREEHDTPEKIIRKIMIADQVFGLV